MRNYVLSPVVTIAMSAWLTVVGHAKSAENFDFQRFFAKESASVGNSMAQADPVVKPIIDQSSIDPPNIHARMAPNGNRNNIGYIFRAKRLATTPDGREPLPAPISNKNSKNIVSPQCSPSPLTPDQIVDLIEKAADRHGVDTGYAIAVAWAESRFDRVRNSPRGARGPMQLMPATAAGLGVTDVCDPAANIDGGIRHLRFLLDEFRNPVLATAAYNAGEQAIYDHGGVPPYPETVSYVTAVINRQIGFELPRKRGDKNARISTIAPRAIESSVLGARPVTFVDGVLDF